MALRQYLSFGTKLARQAGEMIREGFYASKRITQKTCSTDLVTETDQKVENFIIQEIKKKFPSHGFIGEESVAGGAKCHLSDAPTWVVDPIDGTTNFIHQFPYVAVSMGLVIDKRVQVGIVYNAILDEMFTAIEGGGAFLNEKRINVSGQTKMSEALVMAEFGSSRDPSVMESVFANQKSLIGARVHGVRCMGSAALNLSSVAAGRGDVYFENGIHCWDMAAGWLIVKEAGGFICDMIPGKEFDLMSRRILAASSEELAKEIAQKLIVIDFEPDA